MMSTIFVAISIVGMTVNTLEGLQYEVGYGKMNQI